MSTDAIVVEFEVRCSPAHAFDLWTSQISTWWPHGHRPSGDESSRITIEPGDGGRIFERTEAGEVVLWGTVTKWDPPVALSYSWHIGSSPDEATVVEVSFDGAEQHTNVRVTQRGFDRLADAAERRARNQHGWTGVIEAFTAAVASAA